MFFFQNEMKIRQLLFIPRRKGRSLATINDRVTWINIIERYDLGHILHGRSECDSMSSGMGQNVKILSFGVVDTHFVSYLGSNTSV
jgi:hypothetical protein